MLPAALQKLVDEFAKLPSIGPRTAERLALFVLRHPRSLSQSLAEALDQLHQQIKFCQRCHNLSEQDLCAICQSSKREQNLLCAVEDPLDVIAIERTGNYLGVYHVLGGVLSPIEGIGPEQLQIKSLIKRLRQEPVNELIIATNPTTEGEATALYLQKQLEESELAKLKVTRPASGLPLGSDLEYADQITLGRAFDNRQQL